MTRLPRGSELLDRTPLQLLDSAFRLPDPPGHFSDAQSFDKAQLDHRSLDVRQPGDQLEQHRAALKLTIGFGDLSEVFGGLDGLSCRTFPSRDQAVGRDAQQPNDKWCAPPFVQAQMLKRLA